MKARLYKQRIAQLFRRFVVRRGAARPPALRASTAFRVAFIVVRFLAVGIALRVVAVFAFAAFGLAFDGAALVAVIFLVTREARRGSPCGDVSTIFSLPAEPSVSRAALPAGASGGLDLVFIGCHVCGDANTLCLRNSRAASS